MPKKSSSRSDFAAAQGELFEVERGDAEHGPRPFAVAGGDDRRVDVEEAFLLIKIVDAAADAIAHARDRPEGVGSRTEVGPFAEFFQRVLLLLQRIRLGVRPAVHDNFRSPHLRRLLAAAGGFDRPLNRDAAPGDELFDFVLVIWQVRIRNHLQVPE